jgi:hypothetical protein
VATESASAKENAMETFGLFLAADLVQCCSLPVVRARCQNSASPNSAVPGAFIATAGWSAGHGRPFATLPGTTLDGQDAIHATKDPQLPDPSTARYPSGHAQHSCGMRS